MGRLLDTHALYWLLFDPVRVPEPLRIELATAPNVFYSVVSLWEMATKSKKEKLLLDISIREVDRRLTEFYLFARLDISIRHLDELANLPLIGHKDPFDRLLVSQAIAEDMTFVTRDSTLSGYPVRTEWQ